MTQLDKFDPRMFLLTDISDFTDEEQDLLNMILFDKLKDKNFPLYKYFLKNTQAGEDIEMLISDEIFSDLFRVTNENHDHIHKLSNSKVEVKSIRMLTAEDKSEKFPIQRAISIFDPHSNLSNTSFQQIKPKEFDYMIGVLLYKDGLTIYQVPSSVFYPTVLPKKGAENKQIVKSILDSGQIVLSGQHQGNLEEGQISFTALEKWKKFSLYRIVDSWFYIESGQVTEKRFTQLDFLTPQTQILS